MSKIRINELARQLEVKSREVIDKLHELGIAEKITHSSSIDDDKADQLRRYYRGESYAPLPGAGSNGDSAAVEEPPAAPRRARVAPPVPAETPAAAEPAAQATTATPVESVAEEKPEEDNK